MPSAIRRIDVAGRDVTENLQVLLRKSGAIFHTSAEKEVVRTMKEKTCYIALDPKKEEKEWAGGGAAKTEEYKLPDGHILKVRFPIRCLFHSCRHRGEGGWVREGVAKLRAFHQLGSERFRAPEILFDPEIIGLEYPGIHQIVVDAINRTDMDLRMELFGNIVLSGGSTLTKGNVYNPPYTKVSPKSRALPIRPDLNYCTAVVFYIYIYFSASPLEFNG